MAARELVPGDVMVIREGGRVSADGRVLSGRVEIDLSALTGESVPVPRDGDMPADGTPPLEAPDFVFSGATCTSGEARVAVFATGMQTQLGRIAALSEGIEAAPSPLQIEVKPVAWLIAVIAVVAAAAFVPLGTLVAGLPVGDAVVFAIGLLVANVPEGLLPTITLALAVGVRRLARAGALVERLSAVETLGSTTVICTDKTGTLTLLARVAGGEAPHRRRAPLRGTCGGDDRRRRQRRAGAAARGHRRRDGRVRHRRATRPSRASWSAHRARARRA